MFYLHSKRKYIHQEEEIIINKNVSKLLIGALVCTLAIGATGCGKNETVDTVNETNTTLSAETVQQDEKKEVDVNYLEYTKTSFDKSLELANITLGEYKGLDIDLELLTVSD